MKIEYKLSTHKGQLKELLDTYDWQDWLKRMQFISVGLGISEQLLRMFTWKAVIV